MPECLLRTVFDFLSFEKNNEELKLHKNSIFVHYLVFCHFFLLPTSTVFVQVYNNCCAGFIYP